MARTMNILSCLIMAAGATALGCMSSKNDSSNPEFRLWCGDHPCAWEVDEGEVERVPTWHRKVYGIDLASDPTRISQVVEMEDVECLLVSVLADVDDAALFLEVDYHNDDRDNPDVTVEITATDWKTEHREVALPAGCGEARIALIKTGQGRAVVAKAEIAGDMSCSADPSP